MHDSAFSSTKLSSSNPTLARKSPLRILSNSFFDSRNKSGELLKAL